MSSKKNPTVLNVVATPVVGKYKQDYAEEAQAIKDGINSAILSKLGKELHKNMKIQLPQTPDKPFLMTFACLSGYIESEQGKGFRCGKTPTDLGAKYVEMVSEKKSFDVIAERGTGLYDMASNKQADSLSDEERLTRLQAQLAEVEARIAGSKKESA